MALVVSVIVPTKDRPLELREALASISRQDVDQIEVVIVNDGGEDVGQLTQHVGPRSELRVVNLKNCGGVAQARNVGIEMAAGRYIAFLDDDDLFLPHHLSAALDAIESSGADLVYPICSVFDRRVDIGDDARPSELFNYDFDAEALAVLNYIPVTGVVCRSLRPIAARFDASLPVQEDWDMWLRLLTTARFRFQHVPTPSVIYHRLRLCRSMTTDATRHIAQLAQFATTYCRLLERYHVVGSAKLHWYRAQVVLMYEMARDQLLAGRRLSHFFYERSLRVIMATLQGLSDEALLPDKLAACIEDN